MVEKFTSFTYYSYQRRETPNNLFRIILFLFMQLWKGWKKEEKRHLENFQSLVIEHYNSNSDNYINLTLGALKSLYKK